MKLHISSLYTLLKQLLTKKNIIALCASPLIFRMAGYFSGLIVVNILAKADYGTWMYGFSFLEAVMLLSGLGAAQGIEFFATRYKGTPLAVPYGVYGCKMGTLINVLMVAVLFVLLLVVPFPIASGVVVARRLLWFIIPYGVYTFLQGYANTTSKEQNFPILKTVYHGGIFLVPVIGALFFGVAGLIAAEYIIYIGMAILTACILGRPLLQDLKMAEPLHDERKAEFVNYSLYRTGAIVATDLFYSLDTLFLGALTGSVLMVAEYSVATLIPIALTAVPVTILQLTAPYIQESKEDLPRLKRFYVRTVALLVMINLLLGLYLFFLVAPNIPNLFGADYGAAIPLFRILLITSFISGCVRVPALQVLLVLGKEKEHLQNNLFTGGLHVVLSIPFILVWGTVGAATSTLITVSVGSIVAIVSLLQLFAGGAES